MHDVANDSQNQPGAGFEKFGAESFSKIILGSGWQVSNQGPFRNSKHRIATLGNWRAYYLEKKKAKKLGRKIALAKSKAREEYEERRALINELNREKEKKHEKAVEVIREDYSQLLAILASFDISINAASLAGKTKTKPIPEPNKHNLNKEEARAKEASKLTRARKSLLTATTRHEYETACELLRIYELMASGSIEQIAIDDLLPAVNKKTGETLYVTLATDKAGFELCFVPLSISFGQAIGRWTHIKCSYVKYL